MVAEVVPVDDPSDPRLADFVDLRDSTLRRRFERPGQVEPGFFITEGTIAIQRLLTSPYRVRSVLVTPTKRAALGDALERLDAPVYVGTRALLSGIAGFDLHRGAVASADRRPPTDPGELIRTVTSAVVLEGLNDLENLGALARSARAFGAGALVLDPTCADPLYRRCVRVSMGEILHLPFCRLVPWPSALELLADAGFLVLALDPHGEVTIDEVSERDLDRVALLVGAEGPGLSAGARAAADLRVRIPMVNGVDSLNVGHAAAIACQRLIGPRRS